MSYIPDRYLASTYLSWGYLFNQTSVSESGSGGVSIGGSFERNAFGFDGSGGASAGGSADVSWQFNFVASGGVTLSFERETYYMPVNSIPDWYMPLRYLPRPSSDLVTQQNRTMDGGITLGGSGDAAVTAFSHVASGGVTLSGVAVASGNWVASGGITCGGVADVGIGVAGSGGIAVGGAATTSEAPVYRFSYFPQYYIAPTYIPRYYFGDVSPVYTASGGITIGGAADLISSGDAGFTSSYIPEGYITEDYIPSGYFPAKAEIPWYPGYGGVTTGGAATVSWSSESLEGTGGITVGGTAGDLLWYSADTSGGMVLGGTAQELDEFGYVATGGIVTGGEATSFVSVHEYEASGGIVCGGAAEYGASGDEAFVYNALGGAVFGGAADVEWQILYTAEGGLTTAGTGEVLGSIAEVGTGGVVCGGAADLSVVVLGGIQTGGTASYSIVYLHTAGGTVTMGGFAPAGVGRAIEELVGSWQREAVLSGGVQKVVEFTGTIKG